MRDGKAAIGQIGKERLDIAQARAAGGGIAHMARCHLARKIGEHILIVEHMGDMADAAMREKFAFFGAVFATWAIKAGDADRFLAAMLQGVQAQRHHRGGRARANDAENAAFLVQFIAVETDVPRRFIARFEVVGGGGVLCEVHGRAFGPSCLRKQDYP